LPEDGAQPNPLVIAVSPSSSGRLRPLAEYLSGKLSVGVEFLSNGSYDAMLDNMAHRRAHAASFPPLTCATARKHLPIVLLATATSGDSPSYIGYMVVKRSSNYIALESLRGKRVAWVDPLSTSGFLFAQESLARRGIEPRKFFGSEVFAGTHESAIRMVAHGQVEVAATSSGFVDHGLYTRMPEAADLRVVAKTAHIPFGCFAIRKDVSRAFAQRLQTALFDLHRDRKYSELMIKAWGLGGFSAPNHRGYDAIDEIVRHRKISVSEAVAREFQ